ncbi:hypothetical protein PM3016_6622 [Paenibacillus mucilaginosus 3016]|uniref:Uncharacterized protein n=1 Tax=Paenibacillus mucilaginosus 3016 TaxID=1116391 RepID=H6NM75_9BACL|nr:hypothetical protein [Paenibacillus mucilaginosus]AFC33237.1 hypothetical protein PM3016_6622 [Paenibacillus mucilaginosus 3016]WFA21664.1 hypothetical protein ERY13_32905 [Paenibacillus mucilaginosus]
MPTKNRQGCPKPRPITLQQRLRLLLGKKVTVYSPGFPKLTRTVGVLTCVSHRNFKVGSRVFDYNTSFYIVLGCRASQRLPYEVVAAAEDIGSLTGKLICVGRGFVEFIQVPGRSVPTIFPLNRFTNVTCSEEGEE